MNELFFDTVTLTGEQVRTPDGLVRTLAELGIPAGAPLSLYASDLTVAAAPGRDLLLVADRLNALAPMHFVAPAGTTPRTVEVWAQHVDGDLDVRCQGSTGAAGPAGKAGTPAVFGFEFLDPGDGPVTKPIRVKVLKKPAGDGGPGGAGGPGGPGGSVRISYATATRGPRAAAPGGLGGPGGPGGPGGAGGRTDEGVVPPGRTGPAGARGPAGAPGGVAITGFTAKDFLERSAARSAGMSTVWAAHRLRVAEHHYRVGTGPSLALARAHLVPLVDRPGTGQAQARARRLLQQLFEGTTYSGEPRDVDVTPDVVFAAQDNLRLWDVALGLLGHAQTIAGTAVVQDTFAQQLRNAALQGGNTQAAAETRIAEAAEHLRTARSSTDVAQGRVSALDARLAELQKEIAAEAEPATDLFGIMTKVVAVGAAIAGVATGVGAGVAAVAALGQGFAMLSKTAGDAKTMYDLVSDVKKKLDSKDMSGFKTSFKDLGDAGKSIFHLGAMVDELSNLGANHPSPKLREMATVQRERVLLLKEVALHRQGEKEAQLGVVASTAERDAVAANVGLSNKLAAQLDSDVQLKADPVLRTLLTSVHQLLDVLSIAVFRTVRAKEIYLGLDPVGVVRHDLGHLHPDRERMLRPADQVREITEQVAPRALEIVRWSSLVDQMDGVAGLSRTPVPFWFSTEDAAHLESFRSGRSFGFRIPVEDLLEEDGAQLYETKFDSVTVLLHGASIPTGSGQSVRLRLLGRWSFRRRPDAVDPGGRVVEHTLPPHEIHLSCRATEKAVEARPAVPVNPAGQPPQSLWGRGIAAEWELRDADLDLTGLTRIEVGFDTLALAGSGFRAAARTSPRLLRPLLSWPPKPVPPRVATPVPARGWSAYGYSGGVTAVGAGLI